MHRRHILVLMFILWTGTAFGLTLTPVWEITRPGTWARIDFMSVYLNDSGDPVVVCRTDSGLIAVDHTGSVSTPWQLTRNDSVYEMCEPSAYGRHAAIVTVRSVADSGACDITVIRSDGSTAWTAEGTQHRIVAVSDAEPWVLSVKREEMAEITEYSGYAVRNSSGVPVCQASDFTFESFSISSTANSFALSTGESVFVSSTSCNPLLTVPTVPPGFTESWVDDSCGTPSGGMTALYIRTAGADSGRVVLIDSTGTFSDPVNVSIGRGDMDMSNDGQYVVIGAYSTVSLVRCEPPSLLWTVTDPAGIRGRWYESVAVSEDGSVIACGVSTVDSLTSRLEIYNDSGTELFTAEYPTTRYVGVRMTNDGSYLLEERRELVSLGGATTLTLHYVEP